MYIGHHVMYPLFLSDFIEISRHFLKTTEIANIVKIQLLGAEFPADRRKDKAKLIVALRSFSNAPKKRKAGQSASAMVLINVSFCSKKMEYQDHMLTRGVKHSVFVDERGHRVLY